MNASVGVTVMGLSSPTKGWVMGIGYGISWICDEERDWRSVAPVNKFFHEFFGDFGVELEKLTHHTCLEKGYLEGPRASQY